MADEQNTHVFKVISPDGGVVQIEIEIPNNVKESARDQSLSARKKIIKGIAGAIAVLMKSPYRYILAGILIICFIVAIAINFTTIKNFAKENVHAVVASVKSWSVKSAADSLNLTKADLEFLCKSATDDKSPEARLSAIKALGNAGGTEDFALETLSEVAIEDYYYSDNVYNEMRCERTGWIFKDTECYPSKSFIRVLDDSNATKAVEILIDKGKPALKYLSDVTIRTYSENVRIKAIQALGEIGGTEDFVLEALSKAAIGDFSLDKDFNKDDFVDEDNVKTYNNVNNAVEAVKILKEKGGPALEYLKKVAEDSNYDSARSLAIWAIGEIVKE